MEDVLLISENFIKDHTNLSDNINTKLMFAAINESQEINLRDIIGSKLLDKVKSLVADDSIKADVNIKYKELVLMAQFYLCYQVAANICMLTAVKIDNAGVVQVTDDNMTALDIDDVNEVMYFYQHKADYYADRLQRFILKNRNSYPELNNEDCYDIKSNLDSSFTSGLWLGGARGKGAYRLRNKYNK